MAELWIGAIVVNVRDMARATAFWCAALGYRPRDADPGADPEADFRVLADPERRGVQLSLQLTADAPPDPPYLHLDLYAADQKAEVARLVGLGAVEATDWPYPQDDPDFVVLHDPDGNVFCVIDHAPDSAEAERTG
jgi:catechol 2,3-dioxygenase-like lactoylglutathione lyase family enzyme